MDLSKVHLPPGFRISIFVEEIPNARIMAFSPAGTMLVSSTSSGRIYALPDRNHTGHPERTIIFAQGLRQPHGLVFSGNDLYVAENHRIIFYRGVEPGLAASTPQEITPIVAGEGHFTRTVILGPDGRLYVAAGSSCNVCVESDPRRAAVWRYNLDGSGGELFARGLRNSVGLRFHPSTGELWATDNGRDTIGDDLPPEEINILRAGADYGWPYCYGDRVPNPEFNNASRCASTESPAWTFQAHSAGLGIEFYTGSWFPAEYRGDAFVATHGSWNRSIPTGYRVARVRVRDGRPAGMEDFVSGLLSGNLTMARPMDVVTGPDGALYISDDTFNRIFRITYDAPAGPPAANPGGVVNAATWSSQVVAAPGSLISIFGTNFLGRAWQAVALPLPTQVDSLSLTIGGRAVPLLYASSLQINAQVPSDVSGDVELQLITAGGSRAVTLRVLPAAPGIFAVRRVGDHLEIYGTGLGGLSPTVSLGGRNAPVLYAGPAPGLVGVDQVNIQVPPGLSGQVSVSMSAGGQSSNIVVAVLQN